LGRGGKGVCGTGVGSGNSGTVAGVDGAWVCDGPSDWSVGYELGGGGGESVGAVNTGGSWGGGVEGGKISRAASSTFVSQTCGSVTGGG